MNSASNPAPPGSVVSLYATGLGAPSDSPMNGAISTAANNDFQGRIEAAAGPDAVFSVLYAGSGPDPINGLDQVNVRLPAWFENPHPPVYISTLDPYTGSPATSSNAVAVYTK